MSTDTKLYTGPAILAGGYRAFFFLAAVWAIVSVVLWVVVFSGLSEGPANVDMLMWHGHALIFGYGGAVLAGFALTAIPNWTGRTPVRGFELLALVLPWLIARLAELMLLLGYELEPVRAGAEILFLAFFVTLAAREVIAAQNWRNMKIIIFFALYFTAAVAANLARLEYITLPFAGWQAGLAVLVFLITIVGGRIIPAFTGNWMKRQGKDCEPVPFGRYDVATILVSLVALVLWLWPFSDEAVAWLAGIAALLHIGRMARWCGWHTVRSPIVLVLHLSYAWLPVGFLLLALTTFGIVEAPIVSVLHAWTVGGIGSMTLAVMTRATLGHSGLPLTDTRMLTTLYVAINLAAACRVAAVFSGEMYGNLVNISGVLWCWAFVAFLIEFGPIHWRR